MARNKNAPIYGDKDWVRDIFLVGQNKLDGLSKEGRTWSTADLKFVDTGLGGSLVINPLPQPSVFTDPVNPNGISRAINGDGLGPYFSETFDDNYRVVSFRLGTMAFSSLGGFIASMYSPAAGNLVNKGKIESLIFNVGKILGTGISLIFWPLMLSGMFGKALNFFLRKPTTRYAYLKPAMPLYWSRVQTIVNHYMADTGLFSRGKSLDNTNKELMPNSSDPGYYIHDHQDRNLMESLYPDLANLNGVQVLIARNDVTYLDVYSIAGRAQRLANARNEALEKITAGSGMNLKKTLEDIYRKRYSGSGGRLAEAIKRWSEAEPYKITEEDKSGPQEATGQAIIDQTQQPAEGEDGAPTGAVSGGGEIKNAAGADILDLKPDAVPGFLKYLEQELNDGTGFVSFRVDDTGSVSETFSNSYRTSELAEKINSMAATGRSTSFDLAGGNLGDGLITNTIEMAASGLKTLVDGIFEGVGLGGLMVIGGGGTVDMPKYWESSEVQLAKPGYSFTLTARYAHRRAVLQDIILPLACIISIAAPQSTGKHSHSAPLYFEFYDKGRMQSRLAAIDSLTITRGDGNMGFTPDGKIMSVNVNFTITPMEETIALPITEDFSVFNLVSGAVGGGLVAGAGGAVAGGALAFANQLATGLFDDDTPFMDYMATLAGLGVNEQYYLTNKLRRRFAFNRLKAVSAFSTAKTAMYVYNDAPLVSSALQVFSGMFWGKAEI